MRWRVPFTVLFFGLIVLFNFALADECPPDAIPGFTKDLTADCYLYERFPTQFVTAERMCRLNGGNLASINDDFVNAFVAQGGVEAFLIMLRKSFWIGGHNLHNTSTWEWVDDRKWDYTKWDENQPANKTLSRCLSMHLDEGLWKAEDCFERKPYVCALSFTGNSSSKTTLQPVKTTKLSTHFLEITSALPITNTFAPLSSQRPTSSPNSTTIKTSTSLSIETSSLIVTDGSPTLGPITLETKLPSTLGPITLETLLPSTQGIIISSTPEIITEFPVTGELPTESSPLPTRQSSAATQTIKIETTVKSTSQAPEITSSHSPLKTERPSTELPSTEQPEISTVESSLSSTKQSSVATQTIKIETTTSEPILSSTLQNQESSTLLTEIPSTLEPIQSTSIPIETSTLLLTEIPSTLEPILSSTLQNQESSTLLTEIPSTLESTLVTEFVTDKPSTLLTDKPSTLEPILSSTLQNQESSTLLTEIPSTLEPVLSSTLQETTKLITNKPSTLESTLVTEFVTDKPSTLQDQSSSTLLTDKPPTLEPILSSTLQETTKLITDKPSTQKLTTNNPSTTTLKTDAPSTGESSTTPKITSTPQKTTQKISTRAPSTPTTTSEPSTTTELIIYPCPSFDWYYEEEDNQCYYGMVSDGWEKDEKKCKSMDSHLVSIHNKSQNSQVKYIAYKSSKTKGKVDVSIGLREAKVNGRRQWQWIDGSPLDYKNWDSSYAGMPSGDLKCATYFTNTQNPKKLGLWKYVDCDQTQAQAVCMQKANFDHYPKGKMFKFIQNGQVVDRPISRSDRHRIKTRI